jgi:AraC-like DNA-binding protein
MIPRHTAIELRLWLQVAKAPHLIEVLGDDAAVADDLFHGMIELPKMHALIEAALLASKDPLLGVKVAQATAVPESRKSFRALGLLMLCSPNLKTTFSLLSTYQRLFNEGDKYRVIEQGAFTHIQFLPWGPERDAQVHMAEKTVVQILRILTLGSPPARAHAVHLRHGSRPGGEGLAEVIGLTPLYNAPVTEVIVKTDELFHPLKESNAPFFGFFRDHLRERYGGAEDVSESGEFSERVALTIRRGLKAGAFSTAWLVGELGCSVRTAQRNLAESGSSLKALLEAERRELASVLLREDWSLADVSRSLGYSGASAFVRAFRRWHGTTPESWRRQRLVAFGKQSAPQDA